MPDGELTDTQQALNRKLELEVALQAAPAAAELRAAYFDHLQMLASGHTGLACAMLPEVGYPLYFRGATPDAANLVQVFRDRVLDVPLSATPRRILVLGAYAGYAAVWLALRHPLAEIAAVEPLPANQRLLALNTGPLPRVRLLRVAAWHSSARLAVGARLAGDWAPSLRDAAEAEERVVPALPVADLLGALNWPGADTLLCDVVGAEAAVFADSQAPWLRQLDTALVKLYPGLAPGGEAAVAACFPAAFYDRSRPGEYEHFARRVPLYLYPPAPPRLRLISDAPGLDPLLLHNLEPVPWAFFVLDGRSCQLHPNMPGQPPARAEFPRVLAGHTHFSATLLHAGPGGSPIAFTMILERPDGTALARAEQVVAVGERVGWVVPLPAPAGPHRVVLETAMAPGADNNNNAWARWLDPGLS